MIDTENVSRRIGARSRPAYFAAAILTIAAGLASRKYPQLLPAVFGKYPGDALWAVLVFLIWALALPAASTSRLAGLALIMSVLDEVSQLYHAPWIDAVRRTTIGHLIVGYDFAWADIAAYVVGIAGAGLLGALLRRTYGHGATLPVQPIDRS